MSAGLWIPITIWAAFAQTVRNAAQRHLTGELGTLGATLVRFLYGLPFALLWLFAVCSWQHAAVPHFTAASFGWTALGAVAQVVATALLLRAMAERNFALGVAWSKTEILQVAVFGLVLLGDRLTPLASAAVVVATAGVVMLSAPWGSVPLRAMGQHALSRPALIGLASGLTFAIAAVGYRGAALALAPDNPVLAGATALAAAQTIQVVILGGWIWARDAAVLARTVRAWRASLIAGLMGAAASAGWFTAMAMEPVANVRTLALVELFFSYIVSRRIFRERLSPIERWGMVLVALGLVGVVNAR